MIVTLIQIQQELIILLKCYSSQYWQQMQSLSINFRVDLLIVLLHVSGARQKIGYMCYCLGLKQFWACIHKKYFWVADGYVSSLNIKDTVVAYVSPLHPSPYPIIFTKHHLYVYCGTFEIYPQTSSSKRIQYLVTKMQNNTPLTAHEQTKLESFYKEYECAHRSEKNLKQVVICSSVIGTQLYVAPDAEPLSFTEWMTKTYEPFVLRNIKNNLHPSKRQISKTFWSIQKYMGYHTQKLKQNEDMYNICSGKIGTNG